MNEVEHSMYQLVAYNEVQTIPHIYNSFFNPNICHVCKIAQNVNYTCDQCYMISYCSEKHRFLHKNEHTQLCTIIKVWLETSTGRDTRYLTTHDWLESRKRLEDFVRSYMSRNLQLYERQMIFFAKSCLICHQQTNLYTCTMCYSANFCIDHNQDFVRHHRLSCDDLLFFLTFTIKFPHNTDVVAVLNRVLQFPHENRPVSDMASFIQHYYPLRACRYPVTWIFDRYYCSDYVSSPLTLYYSMKNANLLHLLHTDHPMCVIHIIAADIVEYSLVSAWELLLHLLPDVKDLIIVLIAPELKNDRNFISVCTKCANRHQKLRYQCYSMPYYEYVNSKFYILPNMIAGFQVDFNDGETWPRSILQIRNQCCPLLLTTISKIKFVRSKDRIELILGSSSNCVYQGVNKFSSFASTRYLKDGGLYFRNKFLTLYSNLIIPS